MELDQAIFLLLALPVVWISFLLGGRFVSEIGRKNE